MRFTHVVSKRADPFIGISIGLAAFYLAERRENRPPGHTLIELIKARWFSK